MFWTVVYVGVGALATIGALWLVDFVYTTYLWRGVSNSSFAALLRNFMIAHDDSGSCLIEHARTPAAAVRVTRIKGTDTRCDLAIDVSRTSLAESKLPELQICFAWWKVSPFVPQNEPGVLLRVEWHVPDFWDQASGGPAANMAKKVFDTLGLGPEARFRYRVSGPVSRRAFKRIDDL